MSKRQSRPDLAAMLGPLLRELVAAELPILERHGLSMWGYTVLTELDNSPVRTQAALAAAIGADKTRIIAVLDDLQQLGYIDRRPDPEDRRVRLLELSERGRAIKRQVQQAIQRGEEHWLSQLTPSDRKSLLRILQQLTPRPAGE